MNCNTTHYRANSSSVPGDPTLKARGGFVIGIAPQQNEVFEAWLKVPDCGPAQPIVSIIPIQVLAYFLAVQRGKDPDMPRNLAKSVTVK